MIRARRVALGRKVAKTLYPIRTIKNTTFNFGYEPNQLRPDGSRDPRAEENILTKLVMRVNGLSGQLI